MNKNIQKELNIINKKINNMKVIDNLNKDLKKILKNNNTKPKTFPQQKPKTFPQKKPKTFPQQRTNKPFQKKAVNFNRQPTQVSVSLKKKVVKPAQKNMLNKPKVNVKPPNKIVNTIWKIFVIVLFIAIIIITSVILYRIHHTLYIYDVKEIPLAVTDTSSSTSVAINTAGAPVNTSGDMTENPYLTLYGGGIFNMSGLDSDMHKYRNLQTSGNYDDGITKQIYKYQRKHYFNDYIRKYNKSAININRAIDKYNKEINNTSIVNSISEDEKNDLVSLYEIQEYDNELNNSPIELDYNIQYPSWITGNNETSTTSTTPNCVNLNSSIQCNNSPFCSWDNGTCRTKSCSELDEGNCNNTTNCAWYISGGIGNCINV